MSVYSISVNRIMNGFVLAARAAGVTSLDEETIFAARAEAARAAKDPGYIARRRNIGPYPQTMGAHAAFLDKFFALHREIGADVFSRI